MLKYNGRIITKNDRWIGDVKVPLPASTARFRFSDPTYDPRTEDRWSGAASSKWSKVNTAGNVWDWTSAGCLADFANNRQGGLARPGVWNDRNFNVELLDTNMASSDPGIFDFTNSFEYCNNFVCIHKISSKPHQMKYAFTGTSISSVPMFDASEVRSLQGTFDECPNLEYVPDLYIPSCWNLSWTLYADPNLRALPNWNTEHVTTFDYYCANVHTPNYYIEEIPDYDVSSAQIVRRAFSGLPNVKVGMYRLYQKLAALGEQITNHENTFAGTGTNTPEGRAERALIPQSWGGDLVEE